MLLTTEREASKLMYGIRLSNMRERPPAGVAFSLHLEGDEWMVQEKRGRWLALLRKEPVLCIAAVCAAVSTLLNPPSPAYLNYIDWRVLTLLFCLMAVVAGLQECGVFAVLAQRLLAGERRMRLVSLALVLLPFFVSMVVTNDVALITFVPFAVLVLGLIGRTEYAELRRPGRLGLMAGLFVLCLLSVFRVLPYPALLAVVAGGLLLFDRGLFRRVDYGLLATFFCFFLFAGNIGACGPVHAALASLMEGHTALTTGLTSQIISNVPAAVLLSGFTADWRGLLVGSNLGGLGTPIASLASLISLKVYLRTPGARPGRYLLLFTAANGAALVLLCLCAALLAG